MSSAPALDRDDVIDGPVASALLNEARRVEAAAS
jgi:hypothetical protein